MPALAGELTLPGPMAPPLPPQSGSRADIRSVIAPYRFLPIPAKPLAPADEQKALNYRAQLQAQQRQLELLQSQGRLGPFGGQTLIDTQQELNRINRALHP